MLAVRDVVHTVHQARPAFSERRQALKDGALKRVTKQLITRVLPRSWAVRLWSTLQYRNYTRAAPLGRAQPHALPGPLIVSLTSYPPRYPTLHLTLQSLLRQNTPADRVVLWIAEGDVAAIPKAVRRLINQGVELRVVEDVRSYKKLVFALDAFPDAWIATADDDVFYKPDWLTYLVAGQVSGSSVITCHRAHRITLVQDGAPAAYADWVCDVDDAAAREPSVDLMPTGIGGILYPPGTLHHDVSRRDLYQAYAPSADDLWFFWCARRAGSTYRRVASPRFAQLGWWSAQTSRLFDENMAQNDAQIATLTEHFGNPVTIPAVDEPGDAPAAVATPR